MKKRDSFSEEETASCALVALCQRIYCVLNTSEDYRSDWERIINPRWGGGVGGGRG